MPSTSCQATISTANSATRNYRAHASATSAMTSASWWTQKPTIVSAALARQPAPQTPSRNTRRRSSRERRRAQWHDQRTPRHGIRDHQALQPEDLLHELRRHDLARRPLGDDLALLHRDDVRGVAGGVV